jgi:hypothetical protein
MDWGCPGQQRMGLQELTCRLGIQVGLSPRFNRSINSALSEVTVDASCSGVEGLGLSGIGPSHSSVRMLSSESFLERIGSIGIGWECSISGTSSWSRSSWKIGMAEKEQLLQRQNLSSPGHCWSLDETKRQVKIVFANK